MLPKRVYAKINLDNIQKNVLSVMERSGDGIRVMGIVKADGYGHGAVETAKALSEIGVYAFGVAAVGEAVNLRRNGVEEPILILGQVFPEDYPLLLEYNIDAAVFDTECAKALSAEAEKLGKKAGVYLKIDTGMGRVGFQTDENGFNGAKDVFKNGGLAVLGAFTHFARADERDKTSAENQKKKFLEFTDKLIAEGCPLPIRHFYNSASIMELSGYSGEMVRSGIMTYGLYPSDEMDRSYPLYPAMELKSSVAFVKTVGKGFTVSYGSTFVTDRETKIATIPVGYADGYPRYLSNKGSVIIKGVRCPIIGRVCMDQFMVDVTALPDVRMGDEVTLVGTDGNETITVEDVSDSEYRFNYEFCCLINERVPRVYIKNGRVLKIKDCYA